MIIGSHGLTQEGGGRRGGSPKAEARKRDKAPHEVNTRYPREITVGGHTNDVQLLRYDVTWFALHEVQAFRSVTKLIGKRSGRLPRARECVKSSKLKVVRHCVHRRRARTRVAYAVGTRGRPSECLVRVCSDVGRGVQLAVRLYAVQREVMGNFANI